MTREDIEQLNVVEPYCFESDREEQWYNIGLKYGLEIADGQPKSPWISVENDLPYNHKELVTKDGITTKPVPTISYDGLLGLHNMVKVMSSKGGDRWIWEEGISPKYWFNLPDLN